MLDILSISYVIGETLSVSSDSEIDPSKRYVTYSYSPIVPDDTDNPFENSWYEFISGEYRPTKDVSVDPEKEYFEYIAMDVDSDNEGNPSESGWMEVGSGITVSDLQSTVTILNKTEIQEQEIEDVDLG